VIIPEGVSSLSDYVSLLVYKDTGVYTVDVFLKAQ
jgi:hypothetical protein